MFDRPLNLTRPGLFITGTDTGVGKTVISASIAASLRRRGQRVGVCKPMATGCRRDREGLVNEDAEALAHFADCRASLDVINPVRYVLPLAPAVAAEQAGEPIDFDAIARSLHVLDSTHDGLLVEGVGGLLVPIDDRDPRITGLDLIKAVGYPVVVVTRATLGTLNHTAMTIKLLKQSGCRIAGLVINGFDADAGREGHVADVSMQTNRAWLEKMNRVPTLAFVPKVADDRVQPHRGLIDEAVLEAVHQTDWSTLWKTAAS